MRELPHRDPACRAGYTAVLDAALRTGPYGDEALPATVHLRCWACDTWHSLEAMSTVVAQQHDGYAHKAPAEDRPWLSGADDFGRSLRTLAAAVPAQRVGRVTLHAERRTGWGSALSTDDVYEWLVADAEGNVLGVVGRYRGQRGGDLYRCGLIGLGGVAEGFKTSAAAAKRVAQEALA